MPDRQTAAFVFLEEQSQAGAIRREDRKRASLASGAEREKRYPEGDDPSRGVMR